MQDIEELLIEYNKKLSDIKYYKKEIRRIEHENYDIKTMDYTDMPKRKRNKKYS